MTGQGRDETGEFRITGKVHEDGGVDFKKTYKDRHTVEYHGRLNGAEEISGEIIHNGTQGTFKISVYFFL